jgi:hypothetical protein
MKDDKFTIPSDNIKLEYDLKENKSKYMEHIYESFIKKFKPNTQQKLPSKIELFTFSETSLQVIIKQEHYIVTLKNLIDYYINTEEYEKCNKLNKIIAITDIDGPTSS